MFIVNRGLLILVFMTGLLAGSLASFSQGKPDLFQAVPYAFNYSDNDRPSPQDWIRQEQIHVYDDRVVIDIDNPEWAMFTDTDSMDPLIDINSNAIEIQPDSEDDVHVGDIVSYASGIIDGYVIHRVIETGYDSKGWYAILKGDNNPEPDPEKVRFEQIQRVVVGIIY